MFSAGTNLRTSAALLALLLGACATTDNGNNGGKEQTEAKGPFESIEQLFKLKPGDRPYRVLDHSRFVSGPYGTKEEVQKIIDTIKLSSKPITLSNRVVDLPNKPPNLSLTVYDFQTPSECGGYRFRVYEGDELQILQYDFRDGREVVSIRDYTIGPTPFVSPGLWGPYDHTDDTALDMCLLPGNSSEDGMGLMEGSYEIGWITTIVDWKQAELGNEYASVVKLTSSCLSQMASLDQQVTTHNPTVTPPGHYHVQPGDTLSGISQRVYGNSDGWKKIYDRNAEAIGPNPNTVPDGIILTIP